MTTTFESILPNDGAERKTGRHDQYFIVSATEQESPELAMLAQRTQAKGYVEDMGFLSPDAIEKDGRLSADIDKARGENVEYFIAKGWDSSTNELALEYGAATLRKISIPEGQGLEVLPAYDLCKDAVYPEYKEWLEDLRTETPRVKELAALAKTPETSPVAIFELLRDIVHSSKKWDEDKGEIWFFSIVSTTYESLVSNFGDKAIVQIGDPVKLPDSRVSENVKLIPAVVDVGNFFDNVVSAIEESNDKRAQIRLMRSFAFFTESIDDSELTEKSLGAREFIRSLQK